MSPRSTLYRLFLIFVSLFCGKPLFAGDDYQLFVSVVDRIWANHDDLMIRFEVESTRTMSKSGQVVRSDRYHDLTEILCNNHCGRQTRWKMKADQSPEFAGEAIFTEGMAITQSNRLDLLTATPRQSISDIRRQCGLILGFVAPNLDSLPILAKTGRWELRREVRAGRSLLVAFGKLPSTGTTIRMELATDNEHPVDTEALWPIQIEIDAAGAANSSTHYRYTDLRFDSINSGTHLLTSYRYTSDGNFLENQERCTNQFRGIARTQEARTPSGLACNSLTFTNPPAAGTRVHVQGSDWLHHEWRDGKVVQVTDPDAMKRLEAFEFGNEGIAWRKWLLISGSLGMVILAAMFYWRKSTMATVLLAVITASGELPTRGVELTTGKSDFEVPHLFVPL